ncbi:L,D-transpeptidase [Pediococcus inopinatus]|uniref:L,D-transpeptidase n=1 Tax=Pediococcus inopinatus TaxID=114090 RepID=UPI002B25D740|nr:L,D-transpeptidase [Pediococcus inopinatus]WPC17167.1 L,D-transpeptidase [Pediococcus inopinatus]
MNRLLKMLTVAGILFLAVFLISLRFHPAATKTKQQNLNQVSVSNLPKEKKSSSKSKAKKKADRPAYMRAVNWQKSSETKAYPDLKKYSDVWIKVSIAKQRVYIFNNKTRLYTMYASTGSKSSPTPTGTYHIQAERGTFFYNAQSKEGAKYYVSWKDHGVYLFHSVPTNEQGQFLVKEAEKLGKEANSHGCIRLAVPDAKWLYTNIQEGTKVVIH